MSNLIREQRVDKNGKTNIKVVRASPAASIKRGSIPAPRISSATSRKPPAGHGEYYPLLYKNVSPAIAAMPSNGPVPPHLVIPDSVMFEMCSIVSPEDALALVSRGIQSEDEVRKAFKKHRITYAILNRGTVSDLARKAHIRASVFCEFVRKNPPEGHDPQNFVDGASLHGTKAAREAKLDIAVMAGRARLSDIKTIGITRLTKSNDGQIVDHVLSALKNDAVPYDADGFKRILESNQRNLQRAVLVADKYGADFVIGLSDASDTWNTHLHLERIGYDMSHEKGIMIYGDALGRKAELRDNEKGLRRRPYIIDDLPLLYESGVPVDTVADELNKGYSVNQVLARLQHGVPTSVSEGWL